MARTLNSVTGDDRNEILAPFIVPRTPWEQTRGIAHVVVQDTTEAVGQAYAEGMVLQPFVGGTRMVPLARDKGDAGEVLAP